MNKTSLNNCGKCDIANGADCASCKLASLSKGKKRPNDVEEDDYSISEQLTKRGADHSILYLVIAAVVMFAAVIGFTLLFRK